MIPERPFTRTAILGRLAETLARREPVVSVSAGVGIVAKCAEIAGADLISVLASGKSRHLGVPTTVNIGNATQMTLDMYPEIDNVVERTPIVGGIEATDGSRRRLDRTLRQYLDLGFDGISNFPTTGAFPGWGVSRKDVGEGTEREFELIALARAQDVFTVAHAYTVEHARALAASGADVLVARCGLTVGGMSGPVGIDTTLESGAEHVQTLLEAAQAENPKLFVLAHGGPFARPEDTDELYGVTGAHGIHAESAVERIPIEVYVQREIHDLKTQQLRPTAHTKA